MIDKRLDTRTVLLEAASKLFAERGYNAVSTRDLAEAAQVNLAAIQYHFGSKAKLFVEVVHRMMESSGCAAHARIGATGLPTEKREAAVWIGHYIESFLEYLLMPVGPQACRMMVREVFTDHSEDPEMLECLISSVVEKFMGPAEEALTSVVEAVRPASSRDEVVLAARSISGQCVFYASHRPFLERFSGPECYSAEGIAALARHITSFSLGALGCQRELIDEAVSHLSKDSNQQ